MEVTKHGPREHYDSLETEELLELRRQGKASPLPLPEEKELLGYFHVIEFLPVIRSPNHH